jgi:hypothetical protein
MKEQIDEYEVLGRQDLALSEKFLELEAKIEEAKNSELPFLYYVQWDRVDFLNGIEEKFYTDTNEILHTGLVPLEMLKAFKNEKFDAFVESHVAGDNAAYKLHLQKMNTRLAKILYALKINHIRKHKLNKGLEKIKEFALVDIVDLGEVENKLNTLAEKILTWVTNYSANNQKSDKLRATLTYEITNLSEEACLWHASDESITMNVNLAKFVDNECNAYIHNLTEKAIYIHLLELQLSLARLHQFEKYSPKIDLIKGQEWLLFQNSFKNVKVGVSPLEWEVKPFFSQQ